MKMRNKPKIALITPQTVGAKNQIRKATPPFGITCLAAILEERGYGEVLLIDAVVEDYDNVIALSDDPSFVKFGLSDDKIVDKLRSFNPDIVGISSVFSSQSECAFSIDKAIKKSFPKIPIILGGNHVSFLCDEIMKREDSIDFMIVGEADYAFAEFIDNFFGNGIDYNQTPGLVWREGKKIIKNPKPPFIKDLDKLPFPAWHLLNMEEYFRIGMPHNPFIKSGRVGSIITSRGCPYDCYFCSTPAYSGRTFRFLSSKRVLEMIQYLVDRFAIKELQILDDNFTMDYNRVMEICNGIELLGLRVCLPNAIRADLPKDRESRLKMFKAMRRAGVEQISISVEHGDQEFLDRIIGKRLDLQEAIATCGLAHEAGCLVHANFMIGFPFENSLQRQRTIDYAKKLDADSFSVSLVAPLPGTRLWDTVEKSNLFMPSFNINRMVFTYVNIIPHDIFPEELYKVADNLNRELNEVGQTKRPASIEKYKLFKGKTADGDRKFHFKSLEGDKHE